MTEIHVEDFDDLWLFHDVEDQEIIELRKFINSEENLEYLKGIVELFDRIHNFFK